jgi:hypothetical protein
MNQTVLRSINRYTPSSETTCVSVSSTMRTSASSGVWDPFEGFEDEYSEVGWDGFDAKPISPEVISAARRFFSWLAPYLRSGPKPDIAPGSDGTIGFEWRTRASTIRKLFVEIRPEGDLRAYWVRRDGKLEPQPIRSINFTKYNLEPLLNELTGEGA